MKLLPVPALDRVHVYDQITASKRSLRRLQLRQCRTAVISAYDMYVQAAPQIGGFVPIELTGPQRGALRHAYEVETSAMAGLRRDLMEEVGAPLCPLCGVGETSTLDHYLPKERFAEFSILPENLVPCCAHCNTLKRDKILVSGTQVRAFVHCYYDAIPEVPFLTLTADLEDDVLILAFDIAQPAQLEEDIFVRLRSHFEELRLENRYRRMAFEFLGDQRSAFEDAYSTPGGAVAVRQSLLAEANKYRRHGPNHWRVLLLETLADYDAFCDGGFAAIR